MFTSHQFQYDPFSTYICIYIVKATLTSARCDTVFYIRWWRRWSSDLYTVNINTKSDLICEDLIQSNLKLIHSHIVSNHLSQRPPNKVLQDQTPSVSPAELLLSRETRRTLAQLRTNKSPLLVSYLFSIGDPRHPSPLCPLCLMHDHTSSHLFECKSLPTSLSSLDLWTNPDKVEPFLATWGERLLAATWFRVLDSAGSTLVEWGRQQQQHLQTCLKIIVVISVCEAQCHNVRKYV